MSTQEIPIRPTAADIATLPRRSQIAFAYRCTSRLADLLKPDDGRYLYNREMAALVELCLALIESWINSSERVETERLRHVANFIRDDLNTTEHCIASKERTRTVNYSSDNLQRFMAL